MKKLIFLVSEGVEIEVRTCPNVEEGKFFLIDPETIENVDLKTGKTRKPFSDA